MSKKMGAIQGVLNSYFNDATSKVEGEDPIKVVEKLAELIPFEKLEEAVFSDPKAALTKAKSLLHQAKYHLENSKTKASPSLKAKLSDIIDTLVSFIESVLYTFGASDLLRPVSTQSQRDSKSAKLMSLLTMFSFLTMMFSPLLGATVVGPVIGGSLLLISVLSVIWPKIAPAPSYLPCGAENWSKRQRNPSTYR